MQLLHLPLKLCHSEMYITTKSLGALGPSGLLDFVLRALRALRPCDPRDCAMIG